MAEPKIKIRMIRRQYQFNRACAAEPHVGLEGTIDSDSGTPVGKTCVRFFAPDLGYQRCEPRKNHPDNYLRMYVENGSFEIIE